MFGQSLSEFVELLFNDNARTNSRVCYHGDPIVSVKVIESMGKKLSRKTRRRSNKLVEGYGSRSEKCQWLQNHIWHAKRFKMMEYHGYKIAERCCDKGARATHRYLHTGCLLYVSLIIAHHKV